VRTTSRGGASAAADSTAGADKVPGYAAALTAFRLKPMWQGSDPAP
jgi:hypothetical protein